jgi:hypothetical protein
MFALALMKLYKRLLMIDEKKLHKMMSMQLKRLLSSNVKKAASMWRLANEEHAREQDMLESGNRVQDDHEYDVRQRLGTAYGSETSPVAEAAWRPRACNRTRAMRLHARQLFKFELLTTEHERYGALVDAVFPLENGSGGKVDLLARESIELIGASLPDARQSCEAMVRAWVHRYRANCCDENDDDNDEVNAVASFVCALTTQWHVVDVAAAIRYAIDCVDDDRLRRLHRVAPFYVPRNMAGFACDEPLGERARSIGVFAALVARERNLRDVDELVYRLATHDCIGAVATQTHFDIDRAARLVGGLIGGHVQLAPELWEDEDIGWSVRHAHLDLLSFIDNDVRFELDKLALLQFTSRIIAEVAFAANKATDKRLIDHLINSTTDNWSHKDTGAIVSMIFAHFRKTPKGFWRMFSTEQKEK